MMHDPTRERIRALNDQLRSTGSGGLTLVTQGVLEHGVIFATRARAAIAKDEAYSQANDPYAEHDFGAIDIEGNRLFWKIDYYDLAREYGSPDPSDPAVTSRVMTIMMADEY